MSTDYAIVCDVCKLEMHFGQRMGPGTSLGYGSRDAEGAARSLAFVTAHIYCDLPKGVRIVIPDQADDPGPGLKGYHRVDDDDPADVARALGEEAP